MAMKKLVQTGKDFKKDEQFRFEEAGDTLRGYYLGSETFEHNGKELTKHRFQEAGGKTIGVLGGYTLNNEMPNVPEGVMTEVIFDGKKKLGGGKSVGTYTINYDEDDRMQDGPAGQPEGI